MLVMEIKHLSVNLENCHGINKLNQEFSFKNSCLIYASNGTMKTSFAKTVLDLSSGNTPNNIIKDVKPTYKFKIRFINNDEKIIKDNEEFKDYFFVIETKTNKLNFNNISKLLVNEELKKEYDSILELLNNYKEKLLKNLKTDTKIKKDEIIITILKDFNVENNFYDFLLKLPDEITDTVKYEDIYYNELFNKKTEEVFLNKDLMNLMEEFTRQYNRLIDKSDIFQRDFNHTTIKSINKNLNKENFFKHNNAIILNDNQIDENQLIFYEKEQLIRSSKKLDNIVDEELRKVLTDEELRDSFDKVDNELKKNKDLKKLRDIFTSNKELIPKFENKETLNDLKIEIWLSLFKKYEKLINLIKEEYSKSIDKLNTIIAKSKEEEKIWKESVEIFNNRFIVPFKLEVVNQEDIILKNEVPHIKFLYSYDALNQKYLEENELTKILSAGEQRALYLLNIIYELKIRENNDTIIIADDIADSFDYQNKYAIVEYLKEITDNKHFKLLLFTHNYDFFRTVKSRLKPIKTYVAEKHENKIQLYNKGIPDNIFEYLTENINEHDLDNRKFIASIPLIRNLCEFKGDEKSYELLTSLLHYKENTNNITINSLNRLYKEWNVILPNSDEKIINIIENETSTICLNEGKKKKLELENKIVLSMYCRLKIEEILSKNVDIHNIKHNQTRVLIKRYLEKFNVNAYQKRVLDRINIMTPENIHLNSFMYEPLLDMNDLELINLCEDINNFEKI